jgi:uncharacterized membrane protein
MVNGIELPKKLPSNSQSVTEIMKSAKAMVSSAPPKCRSTLEKYHIDLNTSDPTLIAKIKNFDILNTTAKSTENRTDLENEILPIYEKAIKKKVYRAELKEKFLEYLHIIEITFLLIFVVMAIFYQYTDFMKAHTDQWRIELSIYFTSAFISYGVIILFRQPICFRKAKGENATQINHVRTMECWKTLGMMMGIGFITVLVIYVLELGGCNNLIVSSLGDGNTTSGCEIYNEMKVPPFSTWACNPPTSTPAQGLLYLVLLCFVLAIAFGACYMYFHKPLFGLLAVISIFSFIALFTIYNAKYSTPYITSTNSVAASIASTSPPLTNSEDTVLNMKNNWIGYMLLSAGITFVILAIVALLIVVFFIVFGIHTLSFYSYFVGSKKIMGTGLHIATFFVFIIEATLVSFIMTWPFMRTVINRNKFFNPNYRWQDDSTAKDIFRDVWIKIGCFYLFLQMAGNFEWANKGYCRSVDGYNIVASEDISMKDPVDVYLEHEENGIRVNEIKEKVKLFEEELFHKIKRNKSVKDMSQSILQDVSSFTKPVYDAGTFALSSAKNAIKPI